MLKINDLEKGHVELFVLFLQIFCKLENYFKNLFQKCHIFPLEENFLLKEAIQF